MHNSNQGDPFRNWARDERTCCDGRCNDNQGRGGCPRVPESMPRPAQPRPKQHYRPERRANPYITRAVCGLLWLLVCMGAVSLAAIESIPLPQ
jgi:hypothetical protein